MRRVSNLFALASPFAAAATSAAIALGASSVCAACTAGPPGARQIIAWLGLIGWATVCAAVPWSRTLALLSATAMVGGQAALWTLPALGPPCTMCAVVFGCGVLAVTTLAWASDRPAVAIHSGVAAFLVVGIAGVLLGWGPGKPARIQGAQSGVSVVSFLAPQCSTCRRFAREVRPALVRELGPRYRTYWLFDPRSEEARREAVELGALRPAELDGHVSEAIGYARAAGVSVVPATFVVVDGQVVDGRTGSDGIAEWIHERIGRDH